MEQKKINFSLLFALIIFAMGISIRSLTTLLAGAGLIFVAYLVLMILILRNGCTKKSNARRLYDILVMLCLEFVFIFVLFVICEWCNILSVNIIKFLGVWYNLCSIFSLIFFIYTIVRYLFELAGKKVKFFEVILGFEKLTTKEKASKEKVSKKARDVKNGDFEDKPNQDNIIQQSTDSENKTIDETTKVETPIENEKVEEDIIDESLANSEIIPTQEN